jgi:hypothetical protein
LINLFNFYYNYIGPNPTNCLTCASSFNRYLESNSTCICNLGFYENNVESCAACHYSCESCTGGLKTDCVTCPANTFRSKTSGNECVCAERYYDDSVKNEK